MKQYMNAARLVTKIKMLRGSKKGKCFVLVEGVTDARLYGKLLNSECVEIIIGDNKANVVGCLVKCKELNMQGTIGIVDADFWRIQEQVPGSGDLFLTDYHDSECMMLHSNALENILTEYVHTHKYNRFKKRQQKDLLTILLENAASIGYLRLYALTRHVPLSFTHLNFKEFTSQETLEIDIEGVIKQVLAHYKGSEKITMKELKKEIRILEKKNYPLGEICCGHDLTELLSIGFLFIFGDYNTKNLYSGSLEGSLRLAYSKGSFVNTNLYKDLLEWQKKHAPYAVF